MNKNPKLSILGYVIGGFVVLLGTIRYQFIYQDYFRFLSSGAIGGMFMLLAYLYSWMKATDNKIDKIKERLDAMATWFVHAETSTIEGIAKGENNGD